MGGAIDIRNPGDVSDLAERLFRGEVFIVRRGLQHFGVYDTLVESTVQGLQPSLGDRAREVAQRGFEHIHEYVSAQNLPTATDAVSDVVTANTGRVLDRMIPTLFPRHANYYYERHPNVRFHIPYDLAAEQRREFDRFASKHGQGKITAHGPHRDPWVDCPDNAINLWIAIGPVRPGNGLAIFTGAYHDDFKFRDGYIQSERKLERPITVDMGAGDILVFHGRHLHASELNRTAETRYVISYRITLEKPHYPFGHYHHYLHAKLASGGLRWLAAVPQNLQWSFVRYQTQRLKYKLTGKGRMSGEDGAAVEAGVEHGAAGFDGDDIPVGEPRAISDTTCAVRLADGEVVTFSRYCPHSGGDLAKGWVAEDRLTCPLHLATFDLRTGRSTCDALTLDDLSRDARVKKPTADVS